MPFTYEREDRLALLDFLLDLCSAFSGRAQEECYVLQGSVLRPSLFLLYINDIAHKLPGHKLKLCAFADDTN